MKEDNQQEEPLQTTAVKATQSKAASKAAVIETVYRLDNPTSLESLAAKLADHIKKHNLCKDIAGKIYVNVEGWQYAGGYLGIIPVITDTKDLSQDKTYKYWARCELRNLQTDKVVGIGEAICSNKESRKRGFDEYAVFSMAQTRAIGKAYRSLLGWLMKVAGYEGTPAEEMEAGDHANETGYSEDLPPIPKYADADRRWLDEGTAEYYEAVAMIMQGYTVHDLLNRWKINKRTMPILEDHAKRAEMEEETLTIWRDTLAQIDNLEDLNMCFKSEEQRIQGDELIMALFTERRLQIQKLQA
jgi:hypothetical protein